MTVLQDLNTVGLLDSKWGLPLGEGGGRDNFAKDTAVAIALEKPEDRERWAQPFNSFTAATEHGVGLYLREPGNLSRNSVDNLIGVVVGSKLTDGVDHEGVLDRGRSYNWTYSVQYPDVAFNPFLPWRWKVRQDFYGRFPGFPPFVRLACRAPVQEDALAIFYGSVVVTCDSPPDDTSDKILLWLEFQAIPRDHWLIDKAFKHWQESMTAMYGDLAGLMGVYYGPQHTFTKAAKGRRFS